MGNLASFKDAPAWFMGAIGTICFGIWSIATLRSLVPEDYRRYLLLLAVAFLTLTIFRLANRFLAFRAAARLAKLEENRQRLIHVYRPMVLLFNDCHVTVSRSVLAPRFIDRFRNARRAWLSRGGVFWNVRRVWTALWDHCVCESAEVEYGGDFPLHKIMAIAKANPEYVDSMVLGLIRQADRSRYEECPSGGRMTHQEHALLLHIYNEEERISKNLDSLHLMSL